MSQFDRRIIGDVVVVALDRNGGVSSGNFTSLNVANYVGDDGEHVRQNIALVGTLAGVDDVAVMKAEHSNIVHVVTASGPCLPGDGLVTCESGLGLLALSADCVTCAVVDSVSGTIGVFHAGWKGVASNVAAATVHSMRALGADPLNIQAVIGPSICGSCYEVPAQRTDLFREVCPDAIRDESHLDLTAGVVAQLREFGIESDVMSGCTFEDDNLFSYRRANGQPTGRGGLIVAKVGQ